MTNIECFDQTTNATDYCPALLGISGGTSEARVLEILGAPGTAEVENGVKTLSYPGLGVTLRLIRQRVYSLGLQPPQGFSWRGFWGYWVYG